MVYRSNAGRLGAGFISVCLETRWLGPKRGFYVPGRPCRRHIATHTIHYEKETRTEREKVWVSIQKMIDNTMI